MFIALAMKGYGVNDFVPSLELSEENLRTRYLNAFYWGFVNGMAVNSPEPETNFEIVFVVTLLLVGLSMFATVIGNISSLLSDFDAEWLDMQQKVMMPLALHSHRMSI